MRNKLKNEKVIEIDPEYLDKIYGYDLKEYNSLYELSNLYEKVLTMRSKRARRDMVIAIRYRALDVTKRQDKNFIKELFK